MKYVQGDLFITKAKINKVNAFFELELGDGSKLLLEEEDARKIYDYLYKFFGFKYSFETPTLPISGTWPRITYATNSIIGTNSTTTTATTYNPMEEFDEQNPDVTTHTV